MRSGTAPARSAALRLHGRACAGLAVLNAAVHLLLFQGHGWFLGTAMVLMAAACLYCALRLWRAPDAGEARMMMGSGLSMAGIHAALLLAGGLGGGHAGHTGQASTGSASGDTGMLLVLALELAAALTAATLVARLRLPGYRHPDPSGPLSGKPFNRGAGAGVVQ
ncbi:hypothetical protein [Arthrobacter koreensis]|uniref:hypothetical protein n=1 Tax=Arthrobacter koreensis TaxID=199136 RepID=UPI002DB7F2F9|nr:hypothetical protein [Arthrobacter koreensis]MEB7502898.1 hypothetical protein [Arthrobacter koreensis]